MSDMNIQDWCTTVVIEQFECMEEETVEDKRKKIEHYHEITEWRLLGAVEDILVDMDLPRTFFDAVVNTLDFDKMRREIEDHLTDDVRELEIDVEEEEKKLTAVAGP